jgi:hypothetical protein
LNTASGSLALWFNTRGTNNTASGAKALYANDTGSYNTASGVDALLSNTTASHNTASGVNALFGNHTGMNNTASGVNALFGNGSGHFNTATGAYALRFNADGNSNTATGTNALRANTRGSNNTALGNGAGSLLIDGSNNIYIGSLGVVSESNTLRLGSVQNRAFIKGVVNTPLSGKTVVINSVGQLGVVASSARVKQDIAPLALHESEKVHQLRPVTFHYKTEASGPMQYGLIAEEVAKVYPELVTRDENGVVDGVRYEALTPILLKELQGQHQQIAIQAQQQAAQAQQMQAVLQQMAELKLQNDSLRAAVERIQEGSAVEMTAVPSLQ